MSTQVQSTTKIHPSLLHTKVMRSYQLAFEHLSKNKRVEINQRIKRLEKEQKMLLTPSTVAKALELYRSNPKEKFFTRKLGKEVGKNPNIAESAFHWLHIAIQGKVDKEKKIQGIFNFWQKNPQQLLEWVIFGRSPYTEYSFQKYWKVGRRFVINLLTSTRLQTDSYWNRKFAKKCQNSKIKFNHILPTITHNEVVLAVEDAYKSKMHEFLSIPNLSTNQQSFLAKLKLLVQEKQQVASFVTSWINIPQKSRWKSLKKLAQQITESIDKKNRKLFSAVRLIVVFALFDHLMESVPQLILSTLPEKVVSQPFKRKKKGKLPIKLLMKNEYVIIREGNAKVLTEKAKKQGWTELGFPQRGKKKAKARVLFPPKVLEYLRNGANIKILQVSSGEAPSYKPRVDVVLEGTHECFRSTPLLHQYMSTIPSGNAPTLGVDINRLGKFMVTFNTPVKLPQDLLKLAERYTHLTDKVLKELNRGLAKKRKNRDSRGCCKLIGELNRVYTRRSRVLREILRLLPFFIASVIVKHHSRVLKIEELNIDPTGTKGALAKAIYTMPDNSFIYDKAVWLASSELGYDVLLEQVNAFHTSLLHNVCGGVLDRKVGNYDYAYCKNCGLKVNTHFNASLNISEKQGQPLSSRSFPPLNAREGNPSNDG